MLEALLLSVGTSAARAVLRLWIADEVGLKLTDDFVSLMASHIPQLRDRRRTARQFDLMAERVSEVVERTLSNEAQRLPANEKLAALAAVRDVLDDLQATEKSVLFATDLDPVALEDILKTMPAAVQRQDLSAPAQLLFDRLLSQASQFVINMSTSLPSFGSEAAQESLRRETLILERIQDVLDRISVVAHRPDDQDGHFEQRYLWHLARALDRLQLFGLNLGESSREQALSIAYITLSTSADSPRAVEPAQPALWSVDSGPHALNDVIDARPRVSQPNDASKRVDAALASDTRHLVRGEAGSGKTTLLQWLAVSVARGVMKDPLEAWADKIPFFLPLRRYVHDELPRPEQFLDFTASPLIGAMPHGWVHRQLEAGRGLLLVDGVDELPESRRNDAKRWLTEIVDAFPSCVYVVTSRPPAVTAQWLSGKDFATSELLPMSLRDIESFVHHWHKAAAAQVGDDRIELELLEEYQKKLLLVIRDNRSIRSLATTPLLCAMLCALNRERRTQLPRDRISLYQIALEMLLDRRDVERDIPGAISLNLREKRVLMEELAYWLLHNEQSDMTALQAMRVLQDRIMNMPSIQSNAEDVFKYLLLRSGLIREPVAGRVDFIHRTFQEFLGAARAMNRGDIPYLIRRAESDQWREAIILAAGHATGGQADELLLGLLARGQAEAKIRHRLHLLAVAAMEPAIEVSQEVAAAVYKALEETLPPQNMTDARAVASAGPVAVAPLSAFAVGRYATETAACVRALSMIGGESALEVLELYAPDKRVTVLRELYRAWENFDTLQYAERILSKADLTALSIEARDLDVLGTMRLASFPPKVTLHLAPEVTDLRAVPSPELVSVLVSAAGASLSLDGLEHFHELRRLHAFGVQDEVLVELPRTLQYVQIMSSPSLRDVSALNHLSELKLLALDLSGGASLTHLTAPALQNLILSGVRPGEDLAFVGRCLRLESLQILAGPSTRSVRLGREDKDLMHLEKLDALRHVYINAMSNVRSLNGLPSSVRRIYMQSCASLDDVSRLSYCDSLEDVFIEGAGLMNEIAFSPPKHSLRRLSLKGAHIADLSPLAGCVNLQHLDVSGTKVEDVSPIASCDSLSWLNIYGAPATDLSPLADAGLGLHVVCDASQRDSVSEPMSRHLGWTFTVNPDIE